MESGMSVEEVKSVCGKLETSPSCHQPGSKIHLHRGMQAKQKKVAAPANVAGGHGGGMGFEETHESKGLKKKTPKM